MVLVDRAGDRPMALRCRHLRRTFGERVAVDDVQGVVPGRNEVRWAGVVVGRIADVELEGRRAVLTLEVDRDEAGGRSIHRDARFSLRPQTLLQLEMRSVQPYLFAGMEVGIVLATTGAIVGEYIAGSQGLGFLVVSSMNQLDAALTFALILWLSLIGLGLYLIVNELKRFFIPWHESVYGLRNTGA